MVELTIAERYKNAVIESERNLMQAKSLMFENAKPSDPKTITRYYDSRIEARERIKIYQSTPAEELLHNEYLSQKDQIAEEIKRLTIFTIGANKVSIKNTLEKLESLIELSKLGEEELKIRIMENEERNVFNTQSSIKSQKLISELDLKRDKFYLSQYLTGLFDPSIIGSVKDEDISKIANDISSSSKFKRLINLHKIGKFSSFASLFLKGTAPIYLTANSMLAITNDEFLSPMHIFESIAWVGAAMLASKANNSINRTLHSGNPKLALDLQDYVGLNDQYQNNPFANKNVTPITVEFEDVETENVETENAGTENVGTDTFSPENNL